MSPRTLVPAARRDLGLLAATLVLAGGAVALAPTAAVASSTGSAPASSAVTAANADRAEVARVLTTGTDAEAAAVLRRLGLDPALASRATAEDAGLSSLLAVVEQFRQALASADLPIVGVAVDTLLRTVIDSLATRAGIPSPAVDSAITRPDPEVLFPGVPASNGSAPATPVPVARPFVARATVLRLRTTGSRTRLRFAARCPASSSVACESSVAGKLAGRRAFATRRLIIDPGSTREGTVALTSSAAKALRRSSATVRITTTTSGASPAVATRSVRVPRTR